MRGPPFLALFALLAQVSPSHAEEPGLPLDLEFETTDPASYEVALKDPATNRVVWRSAPVMPERDRRRPVVSVGVPAGLLKAQHYSVDLFGLRPGATPEFVASYAFEVARQ